MPAQKPGRSKQDWQTPPEFLDAVKSRLNIIEFTWDLAANANTAVCDCYHGPGSQFGEDSLNETIWTGCGQKWMWLNPPYANIEPWVRKCAEQSALGAHIACLVPASVGSNWWRDWVVPHGYILFLNGRLTFVGADAPYPKDLALILYTPFIRSGSATWNWRSVAEGV